MGMSEVHRSRLAAALLIHAELSKRLRLLGNTEIAQLLDDEVCEIMSRGVNPSDPVKSLGWWRTTEYLMLADSRLKQLFCGRDLSPVSVRKYANFRSKMLKGKRYRTDA